MNTGQPYAFIHIPKTAGSTLRHILRRTYGSRHCDLKVPRGRRDEREWISAKDITLSRWVYPKLAGVCGHRVTCFSGMDTDRLQFRYMTMLRDPKARFISHFHHTYRGRTRTCTIDHLKEFANDPKMQNLQTRWICGHPQADTAIDTLESNIELVGLTERFDGTLLIMADWLQLPDTELCYKPRNQAHSTAQLRYSDPELDAIITAANSEDLKLYQHVQHVRFPAQLSQLSGNAELRLHAFQDANAALANESRESLFARAKRCLIYKPILHLAGA